MLPDKDGKTCLHWAAECGHTEMTEFLALNGGEELLSVRDRAGRTCLHSAAENSDPSAADALAESGGARLLLAQVRAVLMRPFHEKPSAS